MKYEKALDVLRMEGFSIQERDDYARVEKHYHTGGVFGTIRKSKDGSANLEKLEGCMSKLGWGLTLVTLWAGIYWLLRKGSRTKQLQFVIS